MTETSQATLSETDQYAVNLLNTLIETTLDSVDGYAKAAELARNPRFQTLFNNRAQARRKLADELGTEVRSFGVEPWDKGSFRGMTQRAILEVKDRIGGHSDKPVIDDLMRGEDFIRDQFAEAAHDDQLPDQARNLVERACGELAAEHDEISAIQHEFD